MSKHLEEGAGSVLSIAGYDVEGFWFTPEEFQIYRSQLLKEQREICAKHAEVIYEPVIPGGGRTAEYIPEVDKGSIINAPEPE